MKYILVFKNTNEKETHPFQFSVDLEGFFRDKKEIMAKFETEKKIAIRGVDWQKFVDSVFLEYLKKTCRVEGNWIFRGVFWDEVLSGISFLFKSGGEEKIVNFNYKIILKI